jgi:hypothetical protein
MKKNTIKSEIVKAIENKGLETFLKGLGFISAWHTLPDKHSKAGALILLFLLLSQSTIKEIAAVKGTKQHPKFIVAYRQFRYKYVLTLGGLLLSGLLIFIVTFQEIN